MINETWKNLTLTLIDKDKWGIILQRFIEVLRVNIFMVDYEGATIIPRYVGATGQGRYGSDFLIHPLMGSQLSKQQTNFLDRFEVSGSYLESKDQFDFYTFAVPLRLPGGRVIVYLVVGPLILNKKKEAPEYSQIANQLNLESEGLIDAINEIRVISHVAVKSILDLLSQVANEILLLGWENLQLKQLDQWADQLWTAGQERGLATKENPLRNILYTLLDVALDMTNTECGSIMILDEENKDLVVKAARGVDEVKIDKTRLKVGEGIAGLAAEESSHFIITGTEGSNRIKHLLKRPDIQKSVVMPLLSKEKVIGVLNLHTKEGKSTIEENLDNLKYLTRLMSAACKVK